MSSEDGNSFDAYSKPAFCTPTTELSYIMPTISDYPLSLPALIPTAATFSLRIS